jgi:hypothetical protein
VVRSNKLFFGANIRSAAKKGHMCYGFIWSYKYLGIRIKTHKKRRKILQKCKIIQKDLLGNFIKLHSSIVEAANELKKCPSSIRRCVQEKQKTAYGFLWEKSQQR